LKRIFIAIKVDPGSGIIRMMSDLRSSLSDDRIKWTDMSNIHLTLFFLGDLEEKRIKTLATLVAEACSSTVPFDIVVSGTGVFGKKADPKVIWAGIERSGPLDNLYSLVSATLLKGGFTSDTKPFSPHITLGRIKSVKDKGRLFAVTGRYADTIFQKIEVGEVIIFESILRPEGPLYKPVSQVKLKQQ